MKKLLMIISFMSVMMLYSVTVDDIINNEEYVYGYGQAENYEKAFALAQKNLINKISVHVEAEFTIKESETNGVSEETVERLITTYSSTTLYDLPEFTKETRSGSEVWLYMLKTDSQEIFKDRQKKIESYYELGKKAESRLQIGDALRNYYWALELLKTHPYQNKILSSTEDNKNLVLKQLLQNKIREILTKLKFRKLNSHRKEDEKLFLFEVTYENEKVVNLDYRYYTSGKGWSKYITVNEGLAYFELPREFNESALTLQIEYRYLQAANFDKEVRTVLEGIDTDYFGVSQRELLLLPETENNLRSEKEKLTLSLQKIDTNDEILVNEKEKDLVIRVLKAIEERHYEVSDQDFTPAGKSDFDKLMKYGNAQILDTNLQPKITALCEEKQFRNIPMKFSFPNSQRDFIERVNFKIDAEGKIDGITFSLSTKTLEDIWAQNDEMWKPEEKYRLIEFMEYYKTAYCLKDLAFIERVFAENALIIVGRVLKDDNLALENINQTISKDKIEYVRYQKDQYINHLRRVFASNEFINLNFEDNIIKHYSNDPEEALYAIQIKQNYSSENYGDQGYLFLMMDLENSSQPRIYIRTWQPEKFPDGSVFGINDFKIK